MNRLRIVKPTPQMIQRMKESVGAPFHVWVLGADTDDPLVLAEYNVQHPSNEGRSEGWTLMVSVGGPSFIHMAVGWTANMIESSQNMERLDAVDTPSLQLRNKIINYCNSRANKYFSREVAGFNPDAEFKVGLASTIGQFVVMGGMALLSAGVAGFVGGAFPSLAASVGGKTAIKFATSQLLKGAVHES